MNQRKMRWLAILFALACIPVAESDNGALAAQVESVERAFAATMADRDFVAFQSFLADDTIFFAGETPLRGKAEVAAAWEGFFEGAEAPFAWVPETVAVLDSGELALSFGPVLDPSGNRIATFQSIWRLEGHGQWRIIFDKGSRYCQPPERPVRD